MEIPADLSGVDYMDDGRAHFVFLVRGELVEMIVPAYMAKILEFDEGPYCFTITTLKGKKKA